MTPRDPWAELNLDPFDTTPLRESVRCGEVTLRAGSQVRLAPRGRADVFDIALRGRIATIESIQMDFEDKVHLAVTVDDDPGRDLGLLRQPGHRFFFGLDDVEPLGDETPAVTSEAPGDADPTGGR